MEELMMKTYDDRFDRKKGFEVSTRSCGSSDSEENSRNNYGDFREPGTFDSQSFSPRRMVADIKSQIRLSNYTTWSPPAKYARIWHILSTIA
jgi:hypothetical protein